MSQQLTIVDIDWYFLFFIPGAHLSPALTCDEVVNNQIRLKIGPRWDLQNCSPSQLCDPESRIDQAQRDSGDV